MPLATLEFQLPEENAEFEAAVKATSMSVVIWEMDQYLRGKIKYAADDVPEHVIDALQEARNQLWEFINDRGVADVIES